MNAKMIDMCMKVIFCTAAAAAAAAAAAVTVAAADAVAVAAAAAAAAAAVDAHDIANLDRNHSSTCVFPQFMIRWLRKETNNRTESYMTL